MCSSAQRHSALCWPRGNTPTVCEAAREAGRCARQPRLIAALIALSHLCPSLSGVCECSDFTAGATCEYCQDGYYGNALIGTPGDCQPCPCPDRTSCAQIAETGQVVCTNCPRGQTGERCAGGVKQHLCHQTTNNKLHISQK